MKTAEAQLDDFLLSADGKTTCNKWLQDETMQVYVRRSGRYVDLGLGADIVSALDISSVEVVYQGKGRFTKFFEYAQVVNPWEILYVENVLTERFAEFFLKQGMERLPGQDHCFFLKNKVGVS